jgi:hypothetical protein
MGEVRMYVIRHPLGEIAEFLDSAPRMTEEGVTDFVWVIVV